MRLIFIGPPGSGKGTHGRRLSTRLGVPHLSTGAMLRDRVLNSDDGPRVASMIDGGNFVPDEMAMEMAIDRISQPDCQQGFLFDGFPRTLVQAESFGRFQSEVGWRIDGVIQLVAPEEMLIERMMERRELEGRADDQREIIRHRLEIYQQRTRPVIDFYAQRDQVRVVDASGDVDGVFAAIEALIGS